ncbi:hypothetical protein PUR28_15205 [Streptomyces sp. BE308]|uniref:hypothetical protein n=1 Tax=Streptomyces sp. BE308 TaxID=3002529 RepID=UPI002E772086|nr:hypothetical protein [Streptomyces sp. BE308]MEE1792105.1 hypothetical protein [Streptomyces sp. BE308]
MSPLSQNEQLHADSLSEIENCPLLESECRSTHLNRPLTTILPEEYDEAWEGVRFNEGVLSCRLRFHELGAKWETLGSLSKVKGEFYLIDFHDALLSSDPGTERGSTDFHREFLSQLRPIDRTPRSGAGIQTYIRMQAGVDDLELWYSDIADIGKSPYPPGFIKLDIGYCEYLETLLLTKGAYGWQYLFSDISLGRGDFSDSANNLENMLRVFPELFPDRDYSSLRPRLEARL